MSQLSLEATQISDDIRTNGYSLVDHGIGEDEVTELIAAYANFTDNLPEPDLETAMSMIVDPEQLDDLDYSADTQKEWHKYRTNHEQLAKPGGYTNRSLQVAALQKFGLDVDSKGERISDDPKEFYHFHPNSLTKIIAQHKQFGWGHIPPEVTALHNRFAVVHNLASASIRNSLQLLEEDHPELISRYFRSIDIQNSPLRLLFYHFGQGDTLASGHYDKSLFTMQIAESHMGLRVQVPDQEQMVPVRRSANEGVVFPGLSWPELYPGTDLGRTWHDVINVDEPNDGRVTTGLNCARWALIWFSNTDSAATVAKAATHNVN